MALIKQTCKLLKSSTHFRYFSTSSRILTQLEPYRMPNIGYKLEFSADKTEVTYQLQNEASMHGEITRIIQEHDLTTVPKLFDYACSKFASQSHLGTRQVLTRTLETSPDGKSLEKLVLDSKYEWQSYQEVHARVQNLAFGLNAFGLQAGDRVIIYADTCPEWYMASMACFKLSVVLGTLYTNLGDKGIISGINQLGVETIVTRYIQIF